MVRRIRYYRYFGQIFDGPPPPWTNSLSVSQTNSILSRDVGDSGLTIVVSRETIDRSQIMLQIRSIQRQSFANWTMVFVNAGGATELQDIVRGVAAADPRVRCNVSDSGNIAHEINTILERVTDQFVALLDQDTVLNQDALTWLVDAWNHQPAAEWFYGDAMWMDENNTLSKGQFRPAFSREFLYSQMWLNGFCVYSTRLLRQLSGISAEAGKEYLYDLALRAADELHQQCIVHIPRPLHIQQGDCRHPNVMTDDAIACISRALDRRGISATVAPHTDRSGIAEIQFRLDRQPSVAIFIATRDSADLVKCCIASIRARTRYPNYRIVVIDNQSTQPELKEYLDLEVRKGAINVFPFDEPFKHSRMHNLAMAHYECEYAVLLNNDVELISDKWLEQMVATAETDTTVAGVGCLLLYPDGDIQHAGVIPGLLGAAGHVFRGQDPTKQTPLERAVCLQELSACTAAMLLLRMSAWRQVNGFRPDRYPDSFNDVDLWIRLRKAGFRCLYNPAVRAIHYESRTRPLVSEREREFARRLREDWPNELSSDPFSNPNLSLNNEHLLGFREVTFVQQRVSARAA